MSILSSLNLSSLSRKSEAADKTLQMRRRFLTALAEQKRAFEAEQAGQHYARVVEKWVKTETGDKVRQRQERQVRRMWWQSGTTVMFEPKFGGRSLKLGDKGESAIAIDPAVGIGETISVLMRAVESGECDRMLSEAVAGRKRGGRSKKDGRPVGNGSGTAALAAAAVPATVAKPSAKAAK